MTYTLGSLFDGSGGFPLAGSLCGIEPVWAAEVEPYPIAVTRSRFPKMLHYGDVSKINGAEIPPVDIITFGSPCQDLSIAGKRAGMKHTENGDEETTRSGLFMEAVRIIKEMRSATNGQYPRYAVWENVPGAYSSNKGEDFRVVLEELVKVVEPSAEMPPAPKSGWPYADAYLGDGWSLAYRTFDAQYWGVPQRRRRIYLVADFIGGRAPGILFEREGLRGYFETFGTPWETTSAHVEGSVGADDSEGNCLTPWDVQSRRIFTVDGPWPALYGGEGGGHGYACVPVGHKGIVNLNKHDVQSKAVLDPTGIAPALYAGECRGGGGECYVLDKEAVPYTLKIRSGCEVDANGKSGGKGALIQEDKCGSQISVRTDDKCPTLRAEAHGNVPCVVSAGFKAGNGAKANGIGWEEEKSPTLSATPSGTNQAPAVCYSIENHPADSRVNIDESGKVQTLTSRMGTGGGNVPMVLEEHPVAYLASGKNAHGTQMASMATKQCLGDQEAFSGDYHIIEEQPIAIDRAFFNQGQNDLYDPQYYTDGTVPTLVARGPSAVCVRYIVRRLTPTECARLQGFADRWGDIDHKEDFTDEEYSFWLNVRNTHAELNGKAVKEYTKDQMIKWYNKLHSDSAEYKMWGNGIALPPTLYVMQGIVGVQS